ELSACRGARIAHVALGLPDSPAYPAIRGATGRFLVKDLLKFDRPPPGEPAPQPLRQPRARRIPPTLSTSARPEFGSRRWRSSTSPRNRWPRSAVESSAPWRD